MPRSPLVRARLARAAARLAERLAPGSGPERLEGLEHLVPAEGVEVREHDEQTWVLRDRDSGEELELTRIGQRSALVFPAGLAQADRELRVANALCQRHVGWLLETYDVDCVIDVGANVGQFAQRLRRAGYDGHVVSVEPVPAYAARAAHRAEADDRWSVHQMALGDQDAELRLWVTDVFTSALPASDFGRGRFDQLDEAQQGERVTVAQHRLDTVWDRLLAPVRATGVERPRVYLKLDTQGLDLQVFAGLGDRVVDVVGMQSEVALLPIYEHAPRLPEALAVYEAAGFEVSGLFPISADHDGRVIEYDCTLVRATGPQDPQPVTGQA